MRFTDRQTAWPVHQVNQENLMGKYLLAWLLGVPALLLLFFWIFF